MNPVSHLIGNIDPHVLLGSWEQTIKDESSAEADDPESTVVALKGTGQSFHMFHIDTETKWTDFQTLLEYADAKAPEMRIFAVMNAPHLGHAECRWFDSNADGVIGDPPPVKESVTPLYSEEQWKKNQEYMIHWLKAWERAAKDLANLAITYPDTLAGFVINDVMLYVESADYPAEVFGDRLRKSDIQRIYDACHSADTLGKKTHSFGFYPAITYPDLGRFVCPGYILGTNYGVSLRKETFEWMSVKFHVALLPDPKRAELTFFEACDVGIVTEPGDRVFRKILVNGAVAWGPHALDQLDGGQVAYEVVDCDLRTGDNVIEMKLYGDTEDGLTTPTGNFWRIWGVKLRYWVDWIGDPIDVELEPRFEVHPYAVSYDVPQGYAGAFFDDFSPLDSDDPDDVYTIDNAQCRFMHDGVPCHPSLPDDPVQGHMAKRLVCAPNDRYLLQAGLDGQSVIDGVVAYVADTSLHSAADALDPRLHYGNLLSDAKAALGTTAIGSDRLLIAMHTAFPSASNKADPRVLLNRLRVAAGVTGAAGVYRFPLAMYFMNPSDWQGIFAERLPKETDGATFMAQWPTRQELLPGWYQQWVHLPPAGTDVTMTVDVWDNQDGGNPSGMLKSITGGALPSSDPFFGGVDPFSDDAAPATVPVGGTELISNTADPVIARVSNAGETAIYTWVFFHAKDTSGSDIPRTDWEFQSGVTDSNTLEIYERVTRFFRQVRVP